MGSQSQMHFRTQDPLPSQSSKGHAPLFPHGVSVCLPPRACVHISFCFLKFGVSSDSLSFLPFPTDDDNRERFHSPPRCRPRQCSTCAARRAPACSSATACHTRRGKTCAARGAPLSSPRRCRWISCQSQRVLQRCRRRHHQRRFRASGTALRARWRIGARPHTASPAHSLPPSNTSTRGQSGMCAKSWITAGFHIPTSRRSASLSNACALQRPWVPPRRPRSNRSRRNAQRNRRNAPCHRRRHHLPQTGRAAFSHAHGAR